MISGDNSNKSQKMFSCTLIYIIPHIIKIITLHIQYALGVFQLKNVGQSKYKKIIAVINKIETFVQLFAFVLLLQFAMLNVGNHTEKQIIVSKNVDHEKSKKTDIWTQLWHVGRKGPAKTAPFGMRCNQCTHDSNLSRF